MPSTPPSAIWGNHILFGLHPNRLPRFRALRGYAQIPLPAALTAIVHGVTIRTLSLLGRDALLVGHGSRQYPSRQG